MIKPRRAHKAQGVSHSLLESRTCEVVDVAILLKACVSQRYILRDSLPTTHERASDFRNRLCRGSFVCHWMQRRDKHTLPQRAISLSPFTTTSCLVSPRSSTISTTHLSTTMPVHHSQLLVKASPADRTFLKLPENILYRSRSFVLQEERISFDHASLETEGDGQDDHQPLAACGNAYHHDMPAR